MAILRPCERESAEGKLDGLALDQPALHQGDVRVVVPLSGHTDVERALRRVGPPAKDGLHSSTPRDADAGVKDVLGPKLNVLDTGALERLHDLLGESVVVHDNEIDLISHGDGAINRGRQASPAR